MPPLDLKELEPPISKPLVQCDAESSLRHSRRRQPGPACRRMIGMTTVRQASRWLSLVIGVAILHGCSHSPSLVGTWSYDRTPAGADFGARFNPDGTYEEWFKGSKINNTSKGT